MTCLTMPLLYCLMSPAGWLMFYIFQRISCYVLAATLPMPLTLLLLPAMDCLHPFTHLPYSHSCRQCQCYCAIMLLLLPCIGMLCFCCMLDPLFTVAMLSLPLSSIISIAFAIIALTIISLWPLPLPLLCHFHHHWCPCPFPCCCHHCHCPFLFPLPLPSLPLPLLPVDWCLFKHFFVIFLLLVWYCRSGGCHQLLDDCCCHFCLNFVFVIEVWRQSSINLFPFLLLQIHMDLLYPCTEQDVLSCKRRNNFHIVCSHTKAYQSYKSNDPIISKFRLEILLCYVRSLPKSCKSGWMVMFITR